MTYSTINKIIHTKNIKVCVVVLYVRVYSDHTSLYVSAYSDYTCLRIVPIRAHV